MKIPICEHGVPVSIDCHKCNKKRSSIPLNVINGLCIHGVSAIESCAKCEVDQDIIDKYVEKVINVTPGYEELARVLESAFDQSATGKGKERHASDKPFTEQPIMEIGRMVGLGGHAYQIMKKTQEAVTMNKHGKHDAAIAEFRGAIVYAAAAILLIEEMKND